MKVWKIKKGRNWWLRICISICTGIFAAYFSGQEPMEKISSWRTESEGFFLQENTKRSVYQKEISGQQLEAWWGVLFPWFCFQDYEETQKPEISFWVAKVLDW